MRAALLGITPQSCGEGANSERFASEPHCRVAVYALFNILFFNISISFNLFALRVVWYSFQILDIIRNSHGVFCICCCFVNKEEQGCNQPTSPMIISSVLSLCSYSNKSWLQLLYDSFFYFSTLCVCILIWWWRVGMFLDMRLIYKVANPIKKMTDVLFSDQRKTCLERTWKRLSIKLLLFLCMLYLTLLWENAHTVCTWLEWVSEASRKE